MTNRIDIELTSDRGDGTWTWRAAGAKQPKGTLDGSLLYEGAVVGDVARADVDSALDGVYVDAVLPPKKRSGKTTDESLDFIDSSFEGGVTTTWKERKGRGDRDGKGRGNRRGRGNDRDGGRGGGRNERGGGERGRGRDGKGGESNDEDRNKNRGNRSRGDRNERRPRDDDRPARPKPKRLRPGRAHRTAWIESLPQEQQIVAEQLSRGGIQAVRSEIDSKNEQAKSDGTDPIDGSALLVLAEGMMPRLRDAEWRDRADAALGDVNEIDLRDLRSVVATETARDDEGRRVAEQLREALTSRVETAQAEWVTEVTSTLGEGRVVRALRVSSRSPKAGAQLPPDVLQRLIEATNSSVDETTSQQRLATVLDAVSRSVVRPHFVLEHVPETPTDELLETVKKVATQLPEIAAKFGITATRRPRRGKPATKGKGGSKGRGGAKGQKPIPPKPEQPAAAATEASVEQASTDAPANDDVVTTGDAERNPTSEAPAPEASAPEKSATPESTGTSAEEPATAVASATDTAPAPDASETPAAEASSVEASTPTETSTEAPIEAESSPAPKPPPTAEEASDGESTDS